MKMSIQVKNCIYKKRPFHIKNKYKNYGRKYSKMAIALRLEPRINRNNGKRSDGTTMIIPQQRGKLFLWDDTVGDTSASSYLTP